MHTLNMIEEEIARHKVETTDDSCGVLLRLMLLQRIREEEKEWEAYDQEVVAKVESKVV